MVDDVPQGVVDRRDRQDVHEAFRLISHKASEAIHHGKPNPFRQLLSEDELVGNMAERFDEILSPERHIGRAPEQVAAFLKDEVDPLLLRYAGIEEVRGEVRV